MLLPLGGDTASASAAANATRLVEHERDVRGTLGGLPCIEKRGEHRRARHLEERRLGRPGDGNRLQRPGEVAASF